MEESSKIKKVFVADQGCVLGPENINQFVLKSVLDNTNFAIHLDIWKIAGEYLIGDGYPNLKFDLEIPPTRVIYHAQNYDAFNSLFKSNQNVYCRSQDDLVMTSMGLILCFGSTTIPNSISMNPEHVPKEHLDMCAGICSKFIGAFANASRNTG